MLRRHNILDSERSIKAITLLLISVLLSGTDFSVSKSVPIFLRNTFKDVDFSTGGTLFEK